MPATVSAVNGGGAASTEKPQLPVSGGATSFPAGRTEEKYKLPLPFTVYAPDTFHAAGFARARELFRTVVCMNEPGWEEWPEHADGLMSRILPVTGERIRSAKRLVAISKQGVGYNAIDTQAAKEQGVIVCNTPGINASAVAELALGLAIAVSRRLVEGDRRMRSGESLIATNIMGFTIQGRTLGIIGMGNIGLAVAELFSRASGCKIVAWSGDHRAQEGWKTLAHERVDSMEELLKRSEVLSVHVPLAPETTSMISTKELALLPPGAILLNLARGGVVDEPALLAALKSGRLGGAALDTVLHEPATPEHYREFYKLDNLILTPHIGGATHEVQRLAAIATAENLALALLGEPLKGRIV